jgi:hypothetical protein
LLQPNVTFSVVVKISTFRNGTINVTELYESFNSDHEKESAERLLEKLNEQRKLRWEDIVEKTKFTHLSRKA